MTNSIHLPLQLFTCNQIISVEDTIQLEMDPEPGSNGSGSWIKWIQILDQMVQILDPSWKNGSGFFFGKVYLYFNSSLSNEASPTIPLLYKG